VIPVVAAKFMLHQELYGVVGILTGATIMMIMGIN
jgi:hypothetical protein